MIMCRLSSASNQISVGSIQWRGFPGQCGPSPAASSSSTAGSPSSSTAGSVVDRFEPQWLDSPPLASHLSIFLVLYILSWASGCEGYLSRPSRAHLHIIHGTTSPLIVLESGHPLSKRKGVLLSEWHMVEECLCMPLILHFIKPERSMEIQMSVRKPIETLPASATKSS